MEVCAIPISCAARGKVLEIPKMPRTSLQAALFTCRVKEPVETALPRSFHPFFPVLRMPSSSAPQYHAQEVFPAEPVWDNAHR